MRKFLSKLALFITSSAMAIGVGIAAFNSVYKEVCAISNCASFVTNNTTIDDIGEKTLTNKGITLTFSNITNRSELNIQNAKSSTITSSEVPGTITSVKIYEFYHTGTTQDGSFTIYAGTASNAINTEIATFTEYDKNTIVTRNFEFGGSYTYFQIANSSSRVLIFSKIEVYYSDARVADHMEVSNTSTHPTVFYAGDEFSSEGLVVNLVCDDESKETLVLNTDYTVAAPDMSEAGNKTVTISAKAGGRAEGCSNISYSITVHPARALETVTLSGDLENKEYVVGESWNLAGILVTGNYNDSSHESLGTLNSLITAGKIDFTLNHTSPTLGDTTLDITDIVYEDTIPATADYQITGIVVRSTPVFEKYTGEFVAGKYIVTTHYNSSKTDYYVAMSNTINQDRIANTTYSESNNIIESAADIIWDIQSDGAGHYTIYNADADKYIAAYNSDKKATLVSTATSDDAKWTVIRNQDGTFDFKNVGYSGSAEGDLLRNSAAIGFGRYTSSFGNPLTLYRQTPPAISATVENNKTKIGIGAHANINVNLLHGATGTPTFVSGDNNVLTVSSSGVVTGVAAGNTTVTVSLLGCDDFVLNFQVVDVALEEITVETQPTKVNYLVGETFSSTGLSIKVHYSNGDEVVKTSGFDLSDVDLSTKGTKVVTITYSEDDIERTTTFEVIAAYQIVSVTEAIAAIEAELDKETDDVYEVHGVVCVNNKNDGKVYIADQYNEADTSKQMLLWNLNNEVKNSIKVGAWIHVEARLKYYEDLDVYETFANPTVLDYDNDPDPVVSYIYFDNAKTFKTDYYVGDSSMDLTGLKVVMAYTDGSKVSMWSDDPEFDNTFLITGFDTSDDGPNRPVVTHKESGAYKKLELYIHEVKVSSIEVTNQPTKTTHASGEEFDPTGIVVTAKYNNGDSSIVNDPAKLTYKTPSGDGKVYEGDTYVTVVYDNNNNITKSIPITVLDKYVVKITATMPEGYHDDTYDIGDIFSTRSLVINVIYSDETTDKYNNKTGFDLFTITPPDMSSAGDKDVVITLKGTEHSTTLKIHILGVEELSIDKVPYRTTYRVGEQLDFNGLELVALYSDTHIEEVNPTWENVTITGDTSKDGPQQSITFTYKGKSASYKIDVWLTQELLDSLIDTELNKLKSSLHEEDYTSSNWTKVQNIVLELELVLLGFNSSKEGEHYTSDVMGYIDLAKEEIAKIGTRSISHIELTPPTKVIYEVGEQLDKTGMSVTLYYTDGESRNVNLNECSITGFDSSSTGSKTVTVSYMGKSASFEVVIMKSQQDEELAQEISNAIAEYLDYFDSIDLSGYSEEAIAAFMAAKEAALAAINNATTAEEVAQALANAKAAHDKVVSDNTPEPVAPNSNRILIFSLVFGGVALLAAGVVVASVLIIKKRNKTVE